jgi:homoserine kinase
LVGADLPLETEKNVAGVAAGDARSTEFRCTGFEIEIYKTSKPEAELGVALPVQQERFWNELLGRPFEIKDLVQFAMQGEKLACGILIMWLLPFGWFYVGTQLCSAGYY